MILSWNSFMGYGIPDLERTTRDKILWGPIDYLPVLIQGYKLYNPDIQGGLKRLREYSGPLWKQQAYYK